MSAPVSPAMAATAAPPVMEARRWLDGVAFPPERPLINVSQAAPVAPPPEGMRKALAEAALGDDSAHLYGPALGLPALREALAAQWQAAYGGATGPENVAITAGCNMAFCAVMATLAEAGDEVILPVPWYFNHKMWLDMQGVTAVPLPCGAGMIPEPAQAEALITGRTRAIVLVTPNNPTGAEYPPDVMAGFAELARRRGLALIVDETYRDFHSADGRPHDLRAAPDPDGTVIQLYSFSKAYRLTGHRVGAVVAAPERLAQVEKFLDTAAICAPQLGQCGALWGLRNLQDWLARERGEILARRAAVEEAFASLPGWRLLGAGAYFAYLEHPFAEPSDSLAPLLVREAGVLMLPGTMFTPAGSAAGARQMRIAFANIDGGEIADLAARLKGWRHGGA
ncbi:hypothetical protein C2I36_07530 [Rhodobacteraceae bacterium WD3A24]|nr:hypothetical protein C2I36_07530 [Rhodobacteraceae bacterium WD3A24]